MLSEEEIKEMFFFYRIKRDSLPEKVEGYSNYTCAAYKELELPPGYEVTSCRKLGYTATPVIVICELTAPPPHSDAPPPHSDAPPPHSDAPPHYDIPPHSDAPPPHYDVPPHSDVPPPPTTADITFSSSPRHGVRVKVDGVYIGKT